MSRTDHPRIPGSHGALTRAHRLDLDWPGEVGKPVMPASTEIAHGLAEPPLAEWERILLEDYPDTLVETPDCELDDDTWDDFEIEAPVVEVEDDLDDDDEHWIPYVSIEQARDIFCGGDFIVHRAR